MDLKRGGKKSTGEKMQKFQGEDAEGSEASAGPTPLVDAGQSQEDCC